ncbi:MAG: alkyl hydroperoxide reductase/thiol specific antioxidant/Mal allergen [uncultured bacterium]|nr:MAG: alkyl hydroperoxide reductase/thiol specific antioxidant/Mal allergen [uncultured bacterium]HBY01834.1 TlpA family protein disulfide reductase [Rikenellaceae bacterium]
MKKIIFFLAIGALIFTSCTPKEIKLSAGIWRATLLTSDSTEIPFNFEILIAESDTTIEIITGDYRYKVEDIKKTGDSLFIDMPLFSSRFALLLSNEGLSGNFIRTSYTMPVNAVPNTPWRFTAENQTPSFNAAGRWLVKFADKEIIGEFSEAAGKVTGSFLTPSGDYRFFEGLVTSENKLMLSCFDGGFVRLFTADIVSNDSLANVKMYSGFTSVEEGTAIRKEDAQLPDAYAVTGMKKGYKTLGFSFPNLKGEAVSLKDEQFKDEVVILQISGSWCPNCLDESKFLAEIFQKYQPNLEVVCLAFERPEEFEAAKTEAMKLVNVAKIPYEVLITGFTPSKIKEALPELENFKAFPTTIIIDKKGVVRRIHSGFSGPGTGIHYTNFVKEFTTFIEELIAEK